MFLVQQLIKYLGWENISKFMSMPGMQDYIKLWSRESMEKLIRWRL